MTYYNNRCKIWYLIQKGCLQNARKNDRRAYRIDEKIAKKEAEIEELKTQKEKLLHPVSMKIVMDKIKEAKMTPEEIAEKLGFEF